MSDVCGEQPEIPTLSGSTRGASGSEPGPAWHRGEAASAAVRGAGGRPRVPVVAGRRWSRFWGERKARTQGTRKGGRPPEFEGVCAHLLEGCGCPRALIIRAPGRGERGDGKGSSRSPKGNCKKDCPEETQILPLALPPRPSAFVKQTKQKQRTRPRSRAVDSPGISFPAMFCLSALASLREGDAGVLGNSRTWGICKQGVSH